MGSGHQCALGLCCRRAHGREHRPKTSIFIVLWPARHPFESWWQVHGAGGAARLPANGAPAGDSLAAGTARGRSLVATAAGGLPRTALEVSAYFANHGGAGDVRQFHLNRCVRAEREGHTPTQAESIRSSHLTSQRKSTEDSGASLGLKTIPPITGAPRLYVAPGECCDPGSICRRSAPGGLLWTLLFKPICAGSSHTEARGSRTTWRWCRRSLPMPRNTSWCQHTPWSAWLPARSQTA